MRITITESSDYNPEAIRLYQQAGDLVLLDAGAQAGIEQLKGSDVLVIRLKIAFTEQILQQLPGLRCIVTPTTGLDHIDMDAAARRSVSVLSLKGETEFLDRIPSTAEHTWALILATQRRLVPAAIHTRDALWNRDLFKGYNLRGKTIGIIGMGRVGRQVAGFANCFGMNILYFDPFQENLPSYGIQVTDIEDLYRQSDIVTIHIPLTAATRKFASAAHIRLMKKNASIINTSRGEVWDEPAVAEAIRQGNISSAATDVLSDEFSDKAVRENELIRLQAQGYPILITPHIAGATYDSMHETELFMAQKFIQQFT